MLLVACYTPRDELLSDCQCICTLLLARVPHSLLPPFGSRSQLVSLLWRNLQVTDGRARALEIKERAEGDRCARGLTCHTSHATCRMSHNTIIQPHTHAANPCEPCAEFLAPCHVCVMCVAWSMMLSVPETLARCPSPLRM